MEHGRSSKLACRCWAVVLGVVLVVAGRPVGATERPASAGDAGTLLELDSPDKSVAGRLGQALRRALAKRGLDNGRRDSLVELRLAMGCAQDEPSCLAKGGAALEVRRLIYGALRPKSDGYVLELSVLVVESATIESTVSVPLSASDLAEATIDRTAERIVVQLLREEPEPPRPPVESAVTPPPTVDRSVPPPPSPTTTRSAEDDAPPPRSRKVWWGLDRPTPRWKWALFGTSAGLLVASSVAAIALRVRIGQTRQRLVDTANDSLVDVYPPGDPRAGQPNPMNDVDPAVVDDICVAARSHPQGDTTHADSVTNKKVTEVCNFGEGLERGQIAALTLVGISLASTLVFAGLLFIHRGRKDATATTRRLQMSLAPTQRGITAAMTGRF
ncbi:MAG TPA: hypothetical protein VFG69_15740 [Nannocystaceae bacterium]|nr:hypothetical protein [Nannocystaceae bacterium]